jgi:hypothetical protein
MAFVSVTRLGLRSVRYWIPFSWYTFRSLRQLRHASGFLQGSLIRDAHQVYWTITVWQDEASMRQYRNAGAHRQAMPNLMHWCDQASVVHWTQQSVDLPSIYQAHQRMESEGRLSKLKYPNKDHLAKHFSPPQPKKGNVVVTPIK